MNQPLPETGELMRGVNGGVMAASSRNSGDGVRE